MRERVARAIAEAHMEDFDETPNLHLAMADAAIGAMREPTKAMLTAGEDEGDEGSHGYWAYANPTHTWHAMVDAALAEKS